MAEYYTKAESDARYAGTSHTHALEDMGGNNLPADRVEVPEGVSASFGNAYTMDEALESIADQFAGKAPANHSHTGYATANHTHGDKADLEDGVVPEEQLPDSYFNVYYGTLSNATTFRDTQGVALIPQSDTLYVDTTAKKCYCWSGSAFAEVGGTVSHTHTASEITGLPASVDAYSKTESDARYAPASHSHSGYASSGHSHTAADVGAAPASHTHNYAPSSHTHTASEVGAAAANHGHTGYADEDHTHTAADVGALPASGGTVNGALVVTGAGTIRGKAYTQQILPMDAGSYSIGASDNRYYSTYLRVNPNVSSDRRCKRDIETMDIDALAAFVNKLSVVNYNYNDDAADEAKRIGLIAQDVVAADPTIATGCIEQDEKGFYSLRAADLVFPLIAAVQALTKRVEELEGK